MPALKRNPTASLSEDFQAILELAGGKPMSVATIMDTLAIRGHALLLVFLSFPLCLPVGIPILTTMLGPLIGFVAFFLILNRRPWLPRRMRDREIPFESLERVFTRLIPMAQRVEKHLHRRLLPLTEKGFVMRIHAAYMFILAVVVSLPLPILFFNLVAALPILLLSLGLLKRDGVFIILAYLAAIPCILAYGFLAFMGREGLRQVIHWLA